VRACLSAAVAAVASLPRAKRHDGQHGCTATTTTGKAKAIISGKVENCTHDSPDCAVSFSLTMCTPCEIPNASATACSLLPRSSVSQATGVACACSCRALMGTSLLVCVGMGGHKVFKTCPILAEHEGNLLKGKRLKRGWDGGVSQKSTSAYQNKSR
jgi:hypothetical protein